MNSFNEFDSRSDAKNRAEYITPQILREFLAKKINGNNLKILEPAIGSGQLLFEIKDKIESILGFDINENACEIAKNNFINSEIKNADFIASEIKEKFDLAIANYPFSLKPTEKQKEYISNDLFLKQFYSKNITGFLDFVFILKSFNLANEGLYFCFPGIGYRNQESKFRKYLIENQFIKEYGLLTNCKFDHTSISILFLHLTKQKNDKINSFVLDFKTNEYYEESIILEDNFEIPSKPVEKEIINSIELEIEARKLVLENLKKQILFSKAVEELDVEIKNNLESTDEWIDFLISELKKMKKVKIKNLNKNDNLEKILLENQLSLF